MFRDGFLGLGQAQGGASSKPGPPKGQEPFFKVAGSGGRRRGKLALPLTHLNVVHYVEGVVLVHQLGQQNVLFVAQLGPVV